MATREQNIAVALFLGLVLVAAIALGTAAFAAEKGEPGHHKGAGGEFMGPKGFFKDLNLTKAQKHDIAIILKDHRQDMKENMANMRTARKNLFAAVHSPEYNEQAVRDAAREVSRWEENMAVQRAQVHSQIQKVLTPEQKTKLAAKFADFGGKFEQRSQKRLDRMDKWIEKHAAQQ